MQPEKIEVLREWLQKSEQDLLVAEYLLKATHPFTESACFHAQQCAEKILKTFLIFKEIRPWKTHVIKEIGDEAVKYDPSLQEFISDAEKLTDYAVAIRYPGEDDPPTHQEATACVKTARTLYQEIFNRLPIEIRAQAPQEPSKQNPE